MFAKFLRILEERQIRGVSSDGCRAFAKMPRHLEAPWERAIAGDPCQQQKVRVPFSFRLTKLASFDAGSTLVNSFSYGFV